MIRACLVTVLVFACCSGSGFAQESRGASDELDRLRKQTVELRKEIERLQRQLEELRRPHAQELQDFGDFRDELRKMQERRHPWGEGFDELFGRRWFHQDLDDLFQRFRRDDFSWPDFEMGAGSSTSLKFQRDSDGHIRLEVRERDAEGEVQEKVYEADSPEEFEKSYPEIVERYDLKLDADGALSFDWRGLPRFPQLDEFPGMPEASFGDRLGVRVAPFDEETATRLQRETGLVVHEVSPRSLAERMGVRNGDVLLSLNGVLVREVEDVKRGLRKSKAGEEVILEVDRSGKTVTLKAKKAERRRRGRLL